MHRIDSPGSVAGSFNDGNPAIGQQSTQLTADWFNDLQENVCYVIEQVGIGLSKGDEQQLYDAIVGLVAGVVGDGSGAVPTTRQVLAAGLASGGGTLANDITLTVAKASAAEIAAGTDDTKAVTPYGLAQAVDAGLTANGRYKAPGGLMAQWGSIYVGGDTSAVVSFPTVFPNACFGVITGWYDTTISSGSAMGSSGASPPSINGFTIHNDGMARTHFYIAVGK